jgi:hypothetical protein
MSKNIVQNNFGQVRQFQFNFKFNFFFGNRSKEPKPKFPTRRVVAWIISIVTLLTGGAVEAPLVARPLRVEMVSPANGSTFSYGSTVPLVATTTGGTVKRVEFYANGVKISKVDTHLHE